MSEPINDGGPAFPSSNTPETGYYAEVMSLRDYFAAHANEIDIEKYMLGPYVTRIKENGDGTKRLISEPLIRSREEARFAFSDAMMKARES